MARIAFGLLDWGSPNRLEQINPGKGQKGVVMGIQDVPAGQLIDAVSEDLKTRIKEPEFVRFVKSGAHRERAPQRADWFYVRAASVLYRIYKNGNLGTEALRSYYGGRRNRGVKPEEKRKASGKIIRVCLQELEKQGLLKKEKKGRSISGKGEKLLYEKAKALEKVVMEENRKKQEQMKERVDKAKADKAKRAQKEKELAQKARQEEKAQDQHHEKGKPPMKAKLVKDAASEKAKPGEKPAAKEGKDGGDGRGRAETEKA